MTASIRKSPLLVLSLIAIAVIAAAAPAPGSPVSDKQEEAKQITSELDRQASRIRALDSQYRRAQAELETFQEALDQARANLDAATRLQSDTRLRLVRHAQDAYSLGGSLFQLSSLWQSEGGEDLVARRFYLDIVNGVDRSLIDSLRAQREDLAARRGALEAAEAAARSRADALGKDRRALESAFATQEALLRRVKGELVSLVSAEQAQRARAAAANRPAAAPTPVGAPQAAPGGVWDCIRQLESGNNYASPGGGAYQFTDETWHGLGQTGTAGDAPPALQDAMALQLHSERGFQPWTVAPRCGQV